MLLTTVTAAVLIPACPKLTLLVGWILAFIGVISFRRSIGRAPPVLTNWQTMWMVNDILSIAYTFWAACTTCAERNITRERLRSAVWARDTFISNISHELRTPLHGIMGSADLIRSEPLTATQLEFLTSIQTCASHLEYIMSGIMQIGKMEVGQYPPIRNDVFSPAALLEDIATTMALSAEKNGVLLEIKVQPSVGWWEVEGDVGKMAQILLNLGGNAIKFTGNHWRNKEKRGGKVLIELLDGDKAMDVIAKRCRDCGIAIEDCLEDRSNGFLGRDIVRVDEMCEICSQKRLSPGKAGIVKMEKQREPNGKPSRTILYRIHDNGPGIAEDFIPCLFRPFSMETDVMAKETGMGLGLAISKGLARRMGGDVHVQSKVGVGSTFDILVRVRGGEQPASANCPKRWLGTGRHLTCLGSKGKLLSMVEQYAQAMGFQVGWMDGKEVGSVGGSVSQHGSTPATKLPSFPRTDVIVVDSNLALLLRLMTSTPRPCSRILYLAPSQQFRSALDLVNRTLRRPHQFGQRSKAPYRWKKGELQVEVRAKPAGAVKVWEGLWELFASEDWAKLPVFFREKHYKLYGVERDKNGKLIDETCNDEVDGKDSSCEGDLSSACVSADDKVASQSKQNDLTCRPTPVCTKLKRRGSGARIRTKVEKDAPLSTLLLNDLKGLTKSASESTSSDTEPSSQGVPSYAGDHYNLDDLRALNRKKIGLTCKQREQSHHKKLHKSSSSGTLDMSAIKRPRPNLTPPEDQLYTVPPPADAPAGRDEGGSDRDPMTRCKRTTTRSRTCSPTRKLIVEPPSIHPEDMFPITMPLTPPSDMPSFIPEDAPKLPKRYLIVEDNILNQRILSTFLKKRGLDHDIANNGQEAVDMWLMEKKRAGGYCTIFMDIQVRQTFHFEYCGLYTMPVKSGMTATSEIRELERKRKSEKEVPTLIVAMTGLSTAQDKEDAMAAGMDAFITKPVRLKDLEQWLS
ncbi:hypothetical protein HDU85_004056 [Gaertneriomyces sp. JEL0708]|nr:hypothetical protein HDU85_004056 [Gaertneriomyces sp. JEL0708]